MSFARASVPRVPRSSINARVAPKNSPRMSTALPVTVRPITFAFNFQAVNVPRNTQFSSYSQIINPSYVQKQQNLFPVNKFSLFTSKRFFTTEETEARPEPAYTTTSNVFISNLPFNATLGEIRESLRLFGFILRINLLKNQSGNPNGKAIVEFGNEEAGASFINNPPTIGGRQVTARAFRSDSPILTPNRVVLSNVPYKTTENDLAAELSSYGNVLETKFITSAVGKFKGIVIITFESESSAAQFIQDKNNTQFNDRQIYARFDTLRRSELQSGNQN